MSKTKGWGNPKSYRGSFNATHFWDGSYVTEVTRKTTYHRKSKWGSRIPYIVETKESDVKVPYCCGEAMHTNYSSITADRSKVTCIKRLKKLHKDSL